MLHPRQDGHSGKPKCVNRFSGRVNFTYSGNSPAKESIALPVMSGEVKYGVYNYATHIKRALGHTKTAKGEYCNKIRSLYRA